MEGCQREDRRCQEALYARFARRMYAVCLRYARHQLEAQDLMQEGFIRVFDKLGTFRLQGSLEGWVRRIMVTTALNFLKKHSRYRTDLSFDNNDALHPVVDNDAEVKMTARELAELIRQLPTGYQTIFNLHAVEGFTHVEIGSMLGISDGTSRSQYARARSLLISWVEKKSQIKNDHYAG